jgi:hypothetical protein
MLTEVVVNDKLRQELIMSAAAVLAEQVFTVAVNVPFLGVILL